jgi:ABC-type methionine transport system permease subunit
MNPAVKVIIGAIVVIVSFVVAEDYFKAQQVKQFDTSLKELNKATCDAWRSMGVRNHPTCDR